MNKRTLDVNYTRFQCYVQITLEKVYLPVCSHKAMSCEPRHLFRFSRDRNWKIFVDSTLVEKFSFHYSVAGREKLFADSILVENFVSQVVTWLAAVTDNGGRGERAWERVATCHRGSIIWSLDKKKT